MAAYPQFGRLDRRSMVLESDEGAAVAVLFFLGEPIEPLRVTFAGDSSAAVVAAVRPMGRDGTAWVAGTSDRIVVLAPAPAADFAVVLQVNDPADGAMAMLATAPDGRTGYEVGIFDDGGTLTAVIRRVVEGVLVDEDATGGVANAVPQQAGDVPASGYAIDTSTSKTAGVPCRFEVRVVAGRIELRLDDEDPILAHSTTAAVYTPEADTATFAPGVYGALGPLAYGGFSTSAAGTRVTSAALYNLAGQQSDRADVTVVVAGGDVHASLDGRMLPVALDVFAPEDAVALTTFNGRVLMMGGGKARRFDPVRRLVEPWTPTAGQLPGATVAGTSTGTVLATQGTRVAISGVRGDEQNILESAVADDLDYDTAADTTGRAFALAGTRPLKVGQPVRAMIESSVGALVVGCSDSIQMLTGDPVLGNFDTRELHPKLGVTGPNSMMKLGDGVVLIHTPQGLMAQRGLEAPAAVTRPILTELVEVAPRTDATITLTHDALLGYDLLWIVPKDDKAGVHLIRDGRVADWEGTGGFFPVTVPDEMQPVAATELMGRAVLACADGYLRSFDAAAKDDDGKPIDAYVSLQVLDPAAVAEVEIGNVSVELDPSSAPVTVRIYGAATAQAVYDTTLRELLAQFDQSYDVQEVFAQAVRSAAVVIELSGTEAWTVEAVFADAVQRAGSNYKCRRAR
ncbi:MAG TPA: hypothetical protein VFF65_12840 [Phycisphaerales bacterium]|nr:hypothetical protein [Phycisphaerales bacterium]